EKRSRPLSRTVGPARWISVPAAARQVPTRKAGVPDLRRARQSEALASWGAAASNPNTTRASWLSHHPTYTRECSPAGARRPLATTGTMGEARARSRPRWTRPSRARGPLLRPAAR
ncbi:unnamed protein product, partial [Ectocarpus sp. 8 AP-2014]